MGIAALNPSYVLTIKQLFIPAANTSVPNSFGKTDSRALGSRVSGGMASMRLAVVERRYSSSFATSRFGSFIMATEKDADELLKKEEAEYQARASELMLLRAYAINAYAGLESQLKNLLTWLLDVDHKIAAIVFYRIVNARQRNSMFQDLLKLKLEDEFTPYWPAVFKFIGNLDLERNAIVHWHIGSEQLVSDDSKTFEVSFEPAFQNPTKDFSYPFGQDDHLISKADIEDFISRCDFISHSLCVFWLMRGGALDQNVEGSAPTWRETFLQRPVYPPPEAHPLSRLMREFGTRRQPTAV